jgi:hypothetical protein
VTKQERDRRFDAKRRQQHDARHLYKTKRWLDLRAQQLALEPLCAMCLKEGRFTPANTCDHVEMHDGDPAKFWAGPFQSLCSHHHNSTKQGEEARGFSDEIGDDGFPVDTKNHPFK